MNGVSPFLLPQEPVFLQAGAIIMNIIYPGKLQITVFELFEQ
jgi:hypothetical protein